MEVFKVASIVGSFLKVVIEIAPPLVKDILFIVEKIIRMNIQDSEQKKVYWNV